MTTRDQMTKAGAIIGAMDELSGVRNLTWMIEMTTIHKSPADDPDGAAIAEVCKCIFRALEKADALLCEANDVTSKGASA